MYLYLNSWALLFNVPLENFRLHRDVTIDGEGLHNLGVCFTPKIL